LFSPAARSTAGSALWLLPPIALGAALRLFHLAPQVLDGDEIHAVRAAVSMPLAAILTTYQESDNCIPLTALFRLLLSAGVRLSELGFRSPSIVCGLLLLALLPLGILRRPPRLPLLPQRVAIVFAWLLALSPLLVFYSRIARSYLPMTLFALAAAAAFAVWWRTLRPAYAVAYVVLGGLAVWLHLGAAPIVGAPFLFALCDLGWGRKEERRRRLVSLALLAGGLALALAAFLIPARQSLWGLIAEKRQAQNIPGETITDVLTLQAGTASHPLTVLFWLAALLGLVALLLRDRRLGLYTLTLAGVQLVGIRLLSPLGLANPLILDRYLLPILPLLLLWVACALALPWRPLAGWGFRGVAVQGVLAAAFLLLLANRGPLADRTLWASSFMHHDDFLSFYAPRPRIALDAIPWPYEEMAKAAGAGAVIEYPWSSFAGLRTLYLYQEVHGRRVQVSGPQRLLFDPALALANVVPPGPETFCASGARFLAVHLRIAHEEDQIVAPEEARLGEREMRPDLRRTLHDQAETMAQSLTDLWGDPTWAAPSLRFWDLDQTCQRGKGPR
jgi:hypothetical protein